MHGYTQLSPQSVENVCSGAFDDQPIDALEVGNIGEVVKVTDGAEGSTVSVKVGSSFHDIATLDGVHNTTAIELLKAGMILS